MDTSPNFSPSLEKILEMQQKGRIPEPQVLLGAQPDFSRSYTPMPRAEALPILADQRYFLKPAYTTLSVRTQFLLKREFCKSHLPDTDTTEAMLSCSIEFKNSDNVEIFRLTAFNILGVWQKVSDFQQDMTEVSAFTLKEAQDLAHVMLTRWGTPVLITQGEHHIGTVFSFNSNTFF